ncbi:FxSxx-COOH system tetratricopeptide repeat protein [Frankia sp. AgPm24]|uniref:FxSxx-COOH system tetratricopeptide repeat protein n=1 Tax=Frankia sp. AgPm24 TaxID=631128 RepID=UPI00200DD82E|nr:FxSxx-COOH system tetratricopeptide repeat protein [Frankia sp. AgPm24]MCK9922106.1 FxSxx-COOH system tetratricopeptide repeat protein [Frankia sp. AgPm24]
MPGRPAGRIVTFYSYKGGTGRSMALANIAWLLSSRGRRVLVVDWDLEAPGLQRYFHPFLQDPQLRSTRGVMDLIWSFTAAALSPPRTDEEDWLAQVSSITPYAESLNWDFPDGGTIDFVCSGQHDAAYSRRLSAFDWTTFYEEHGGADFIDALAESMRSSYDWILIDSRTGFSDTAGICTMQLPDIVVNCFTLSSQSIEGAVAVARSIAALENDRRIRILPVPMRVEDSERAKLERGRDVARATFAPYLRGMDLDERERYWGDVEIPYKPYYSYEEILAVFGDRPHQKDTLLAAYERLASHLTDGEVCELPQQDEHQRRRHLARFERQQLAVPTQMRVRYAARDRSWADWIGEELAATGFAITLEIPVDQENGRQAAADNAGSRTIVILSPAYVSFAAGAARPTAASRIPDTDVARQPLAVRVQEVELPAEFEGLDPAELAGLDEASARRALLTMVGRPTERVPAASTVRPASTVRFPGAPPQIWTDVPARNPAFMGRESQLAELRERFVGAGAAPTRTLVLQGLGGVGKTQIAVEYAYRFDVSYDLVYWVGCDQPALIRGSLAALADQLHLPERPGRDAVADVLNALRRGVPYRRWLLIFDNADNPDDIVDLLPHGPGHVLITSRNQRWQGRQTRLEIGVFSRAESIAMLCRRASSLTEQIADQLADALGDLPLALEHAGAWHAGSGISAHAYLQHLKRSPRPLLLEGEIPTYPRPVALTWLLSVERLREQQPVAARLAQLCAFLGPEPISLQIFAGSDNPPDLSDPEDQALRDVATLEIAVRHVTEHALVRLVQKDGEPCLEMHRLVQAVLRDDLTPQRRSDVRGRVHALLAAADPADPDEPKAWPGYTRLHPHILASRAVRSPSPMVIGLIRNLVRSLYTQRRFSSSRDLASEALTVWRDRFGEDDWRTLQIALDLADNLRALGEPEQAYQLDEAARSGLVRGLGRDHELSLRAARALGGDLRGKREYQQARSLDEQTYERFRVKNLLDHDDGIKAANNLAVSLRFVGEFPRALELSRDIHDRTWQQPQYKGVDILQYADSYARDLRECGRYRDSMNVLQEAWEECRSRIGENYSDTLRTMRNYAVSLRWCGHERAARQISEETLEEFRVLHGYDHRETLATAVSLVYDLCLAEESAVARSLAEETYQQARSQLGSDSLDTLGAANALVVARRRNDDATAAAALAEQLVDDLRVSLPQGHPFIYYGITNLANCYVDLGRTSERNELDSLVEKSLQIHLGFEHPRTLVAMAHRAAALGGDTGSNNNISSSSSGLLEELTSMLGADHPTIAKILDGERVDFEIDSPPA